MAPFWVQGEQGGRRQKDGLLAVKGLAIRWGTVVSIATWGAGGSHLGVAAKGGVRSVAVGSWVVVVVTGPVGVQTWVLVVVGEWCYHLRWFHRRSR